MLCFSCLLAQHLFPGHEERTRLVLPKGVNTHVMSTRTTHILSSWLSKARVGVCTATARLCLVWKNGGVLWSGLGRIFSDLWWSGSSGLFVGLLVFFLSLMLLWVWTASLRDIFAGHNYCLLIHIEHFILATSWSTHNEERNTTHYLSSGLAELHGWRQMWISWDAAAIVVGNFSSQIFEWDLGDECNLSLVLFLVISLFWLKYFIPFYCQDLLPALLWMQPVPVLQLLFPKLNFCQWNSFL